MRKSFGEIGDMRLHVMAALTFADRAAELGERVATFEAERARADEAGSIRHEREDARRRDLADTLNAAAERIERLSATLASRPR
jgi:cell division protein ZapA